MKPQKRIVYRDSLVAVTQSSIQPNSLTPKKSQFDPHSRNLFLPTKSAAAMSSGGGRVYWGAKGAEFRGIAVIFSWVSIQERHLRSYVELYSSLGWNSLICHAGFLSAFDPEKATSLAFFVLNELLKELQVKPCPVAFAAFSAGSKACMHTVFQIMEKSGNGQLNWDAYRLVRNCASALIFDSSPVDITNDLGSRFALHNSILSRPGPSKVVSWIARGVSFSLDALYLTKFESQRAEYWQSLLSSAQMGAPYLIFCSEDDNLAPYETICLFAQNLQGLGADVEIVEFSGSSHIGHYKRFPGEYGSAVANIFEKSASIFAQRVQQLKEERTTSVYEISELICDLQNAAFDSDQSLRRVASDPSDHFFLPSSVNEVAPTPPLQRSSPTISPHGILGQVLFDVCVPKNVEGWDIKFCGSLNGQPYASSCGRKLSPVHRGKPIRRSRL